MDIARQLGLFLATNGFGTLGTDIFMGTIPADKEGIYIVRTGGTLNNYLPIETSVLDIYAKYQKASTAFTQLEAIKRKLHRTHNTTLADGYAYSMLVLGDIEDIQRDEKYAKILKITVQITCRSNTLIS